MVHDEAAWRAAGAQVACTVHVILPVPLDGLLHFIMQHTAHHLDVTIPLYRLRDAQRIVEESGTRLVVYRWTPATFFRHLKICKLYDFERRCGWASTGCRSLLPRLRGDLLDPR